MSDYIAFFDKTRPDPTWAPHADETENPGTLIEVPIESARQFAKDTKRTIWQRWVGPDDKVEKPPIKGSVSVDGNYLKVVQEGREILLTTDTANDFMGLLVTLREEATQIRRMKRAEQQ